MVFAQALGGFPNLPLAGEKDEDIARPFFPHLVHRIQNRLLQVTVALILVRRQQRAVTHVHRVASSGDFDDRRVVEMAGKAFRVDGRRGDDQFQIGPTRQQPLEIAQQEIDVEAAFVGLVKNDDLVLLQLAVALGFRQQNAVGHQLDDGIWPGSVGKTHLVADLAADCRAQFRRDTGRHRAGSDPARLGMADQTGGP